MTKPRMQIERIKIGRKMKRKLVRFGLEKFDELLEQLAVILSGANFLDTDIFWFSSVGTLEHIFLKGKLSNSDVK